METPQFRAEAFAPGHEVPGPAIIQEPTTTVVVYPGWNATVTPTGDYLLTVQPEPAEEAVA
jgi:N-methylhydantoinase A